MSRLAQLYFLGKMQRMAIQHVRYLDGNHATRIRWAKHISVYADQMNNLQQLVFDPFYNLPMHTHIAMG